MPLQATSGAASYDAFGGGVAAVPNYIEDVFSTFLYNGNSSTQTINNGIDLAGKGGLLWIKARTESYPHALYDTQRGTTPTLETNSTAADNINYPITSFNSSGWSMNTATGRLNNELETYASWTFRKQPKFFDVVTFSGGGGTAGYKTISHNLGSVPGCIIVKQTDAGNNWYVYHRGLSSPATQVLFLQTTNAATTDGAFDANPTSTTFQFADFGAGSQFVAYLFAHNAGGFGLTGTDNVISCGSYSSATAIDLGYEPQWLMVKPATISGPWYIINNMTGFTSSAFGPRLFANLTNAEGNDSVASVTATGFNSQLVDGAGTYIYIAIRRGPMKVPTTGTSVFSPNTQTGAGTSAGQTITTNFPVDLEISSGRSDNSGGNYFIDRLRGGQNWLQGTNTNAEVNFTSWNPLIGFANNTGITDANYGSTSASYIAWNLRRAPSVFDVVCYTGTGANQTLSHNLQAVPELIICKSRTNGSASYNWSVTFNFGASSFSEMYLNATNAATAFTSYNTVISAQPSSTTFAVGSSPRTGATANNYVSYLFATCPGVSKVGSYTGNGTTQAIACGFTGGARFVLIKRTDSTGDWYVYDTARGMTVLTDPYLLMNSTAAETATLGSVITSTGGFTVNAAILAAINTNAASYIFLAIA
jgi:hypothetical protein